MSGKIVIENLTPRHLQFRIDHQEVCVKTGRCLCRQGRRGTEAFSVHVPGGKGQRTSKIPSEVAVSRKIREAASGPHPKIVIHGSEVKAKASPGAKKKSSGARGGKGNKPEKGETTQ